MSFYEHERATTAPLYASEYFEMGQPTPAWDYHTSYRFQPCGDVHTVTRTDWQLPYGPFYYIHPPATPVNYQYPDFFEPVAIRRDFDPPPTAYSGHRASQGFEPPLKRMRTVSPSREANILYYVVLQDDSTVVSGVFSTIERAEQALQKGATIHAVVLDRNYAQV